MTTELVSQSVFDWFLTFIVGGVALWLVFFEIHNFRKLAGKPASPAKNDQVFGYAIGLVIAAIALYGTARYRGWV